MKYPDFGVLRDHERCAVADVVLFRGVTSSIA